jgi:cytochrome c553
MNGARTALCGAGLVLALGADGVAAQVGAKPAPDLEHAAKIVSGSCFLCHGADGDAGTELFPKLGAQNAEYIAKQLANFKSGARKSGTMAGMVKELGDADFVSLGAYFSRKPPTAHDVSDAATATAGKALYFNGNPATGVFACVTCHGDDAGGSSVLPRLAGQHPGYLELQLREFHARERTNDNAVMQEITRRMTEREIKVVSEYLAGVK